MKPSLHSFKASQDRTGFGADNDDGCDDVRNDFMLQLLSGNKPNTSIIECALNRDEIALMRIYKPEEKENKILRRMNHSGGSNRSVHSDDSDLDTTEKSISTIGLHGVQEIDEDRSWVESQCYSMDEIHILSRMKNIIEVQLIREKEKVNRTLIFQSPNESRSFFELVVNFQKHKQTLLRVQSEQSLEDLHENFNFDDLLIIMEVCSAWDLNIHPDDLPNMSIACVIMNKREILHETKGLSNTVEPNWTTRSGSLFLLTVPSKELKSSTSSELTFEIVAKRHSEDDMLLGSASISSNILSSSPGNRLELQLSKNNKVSVSAAFPSTIALYKHNYFLTHLVLIDLLLIIFFKGDVSNTFQNSF